MTFGTRTYERFEDGNVYTVKEDIVAIRRLPDVLDSFAKSLVKKQPMASGVLPRGCRYFFNTKNGKTIYVIERQPGWLKLKFALQKLNNNPNRKLDEYKVFAPTLIFIITVNQESNDLVDFSVFCSEHTMDMYGLNIRLRKSPLPNTHSNGRVCDDKIWKNDVPNWHLLVVDEFLTGVFNSDLSDNAFDFKEWERLSQSPTGWLDIPKAMHYVCVEERENGEWKRITTPCLWQYLKWNFADDVVRPMITESEGKGSPPIAQPSRPLPEFPQEEDEEEEWEEDEEGDDW